MTITKSRTATSPTSGEVRRNIITWFYDHNKRGGAPRGINDVCKGIKETFGYKGPLVKEHLTYLVDLNYIRKEIVMTTVKTGQTVREQPRVTYRIGVKGIEFMEGKSQFSDRDMYAGININAAGGSNVILGDGNVVNSNNRPVYEELNRFRQAIADSPELNDSSKFMATVQIDTVLKQLALPRADPTIVERAWDTATKICTSASLLDYVTRIAPMIHGLLLTWSSYNGVG